jgi:hypothetical protein
MKNKIKLSDKEKIEAQIAEVEQGCKARLLSYQEIQATIKEVENHLKWLGLPKKHWDGITFFIYPESVPNSYKYGAFGTGMKAGFEKGAWRLLELYRMRCSTKSHGGGKKTVVNWSLVKEHVPTFISL